MQPPKETPPTEAETPAADPNASPDIHQPGVYKISGSVLVLWVALTVIYSMKALVFFGFNTLGFGKVATASGVMLIAGMLGSFSTWWFSGKKPFFGQIGGVVGVGVIYVLFTILLFAEGFGGE